MTFAARSTGTVLTIDLDAVAGNFELLRATAAPADCAAVVKADAYGTGAQKVAPVLAASGCGIFFVAHLGEALAIRPLLADADICVLNGAPPGAEDEFVQHRLIPVLNDLGAVSAWSAVARNAGGLPAILHIDTGMSRLGLPDDEIDRLATEPERLDGIELRWVMSHLAAAEEPENPINQSQRELFEATRARLPAAPASLANSSGVFLGADYHFDLVRPGAALYGVNPQPARANPMSGVVRLTAPILQVRTIDSPLTVGYGATHRVSGRTKIATIPVGYADGYPRSQDGRGRAFVGPHEVPVVGRVSMDLVTLDVTGLPDALVRPGAEVEIISARHPVDAVAEAAGTIGYEILTRLGRRYTRVYSGGAG